jgi:hypothetical protein
MINQFLTFTEGWLDVLLVSAKLAATFRLTLFSPFILMAFVPVGWKGGKTRRGRQL